MEAAIEEAENPPPPMFPFGPPPEPSPFKGLKPEDLDLADGKVIIKSDPSKGVPLAKAVKKHIVATYSGRPPTALWTLGFGKMLDTMNTAFCEVAVDTETGEVEILRFVVVADPGKIMRLTSLESQIDQVMYFSQGCQLLEDYVYDKRTGVKLNNNMINTKTDYPGCAAGRAKFLGPGRAMLPTGQAASALTRQHLVIIAIHNAIGVWETAGNSR